jgi:hypothetical protein
MQLDRHDDRSRPRKFARSQGSTILNRLGPANCRNVGARYGSSARVLAGSYPSLSVTLMRGVSRPAGRFQARLSARRGRRPPGAWGLDEQVLGHCHGSEDRDWRSARVGVLHGRSLSHCSRLPTRRLASMTKPTFAEMRRPGGGAPARSHGNLRRGPGRSADDELGLEQQLLGLAAR